jgi:hypothetical protein
MFGRGERGLAKIVIYKFTTAVYADLHIFVRFWFRHITHETENGDPDS